MLHHKIPSYYFTHVFINPPIFPAAFLNQLQFNIPLIPGLAWAGLICQDLNVNNVAPAVGWLIRTLVIATFDKTNTRVKYAENRNKIWDWYLYKNKTEWSKARALHKDKFESEIQALTW